MEVWQKRCMDGASPLELITTNGDGAQRKDSIAGPIEKEERLSEADIESLYNLAMGFEEALGYSVNIEAMVTDQVIVPVQIRPVPMLPEDREVKSLEPLSEDQYLIAETPFVIGSFKKTARLVQPAYKNDFRDHQFKEPVIVWHSQRSKGMRFYSSDNNCIAMFSPEEGSSISHDSSLVPGFGPARDKYAFLGIPDADLSKKLNGCLEAIQEKTGRNKTGEFSYTPFQLTIESDGRRGRAYIDKKDAHYIQ